MTTKWIKDKNEETIATTIATLVSKFKKQEETVQAVETKQVKEEVKEDTPKAKNWLLKSGGTIHIKPKNKGKFTETKKETGKSTEELTHSKNPVTKKRAIFAQNAKKWKHKDGGVINFDLSSIIDAWKNQK